MRRLTLETRRVLPDDPEADYLQWLAAEMATPIKSGTEIQPGDFAPATCDVEFWNAINAQAPQKLDDETIARIAEKVRGSGEPRPGPEAPRVGPYANGCFGWPGMANPLVGIPPMQWRALRAMFHRSDCGRPLDHVTSVALLASVYGPSVNATGEAIRKLIDRLNKTLNGYGEVERVGDGYRYVPPRTETGQK